MSLPRWWAGWPNRVTSARLVGTAVLAALVVAAAVGGPEPHQGWAICGIALACEALDGVDGWLARRLRQATAFGARYDMEVDAAMMMVLSIALPAFGAAGWWVLAVGGWRYGYVLAARLVPALRRQLPYRYSRKVIAAGTALALIGALALRLFGAPPVISSGVAAAALLVLSWSFLRDIGWQLRRG